MRLFSFPYAGGSSTIFNRWNLFIDKSIQIHAIELGGRGKRIGEPPYKNFEAMIDDVFARMGPITDNDYAFFGHSMGAKIVFELAQLIMSKGLPGPQHIFFSGRGAPHIPDKDMKIYSKLSDEEFKQELITLGGTSQNFFESPELMALFFPLLRNDFMLAETISYEKKDVVFNCDISVFVGNEEDLTSDQIVGWKEYTRGDFTIHFFKGDHFFINQKMEEVVKKINVILKKSGKFINK